MPNSKCEFVPHDKVLFTVYYFHSKTSSFFTPVLSIRIVLDSFYLLIFYSKKFSTGISNLLFAVNATLNLSD